jgi:hypothetical protein
MNSKRKTADTAHRLAAEWARNRFAESLIEKLQAGYDPAAAEAETRRELGEPDAVIALEREFREQHPHAATVVDEAAERNAEGARALRPVAERYGLDIDDRHVGAQIATDPIGYRVLDAVADADLDEAERSMRHVASRVAPEKFIDAASDEEIADAIRHGGHDPEQAARERYERMTPEQLDREMEKEFGSSGAKQVAPGVTFTTVQK